ncbi:filamentous hemagglutinin N-terminal domain-containing protein [Scytonema sp. NUACC26]|uniref:filamentous hemagglutinin N-terminal domain-containing protein n=1 Tax=Scytonema sp. NUACC26 TaxID=3140176 RepID=UPI0034DC0DE5
MEVLIKQLYLLVEMSSMRLKSLFSQGYQLGLSGLLVLVGLLGGGGSITFAEVTADSSLGTQVTINGDTLEITGGTTVGDKNLFHSFSNFSVQGEEVVNFHSASNINNILVRVTGGNPSDIQGTLQTQGNANLFLINPNGILFGENARLDIGGSFVGTTASAIQFPGGEEFSMTSTVNPLNPLLTVNPSAFLFNQVASGQTSIQVNTSPQPLSVPDGKSLLLVGGDVNLEGGRLRARSGRIELGGLAGVGTVGLNIDGNNLSLSFPEAVARADVSLTNTARVIADGRGGGSIQVQGRRVRLTDDSEIRTINTIEAEAGGTLAVIASELVELLGGSRLLTTTEGTGNAGNIRIEAGRLIIQDGAQASATTRSEGQGGKLSVTATDSIQLIGALGDEPSGLFARTEGAGDAGSLEIETRQLIVRDGARISASTESTGKGGSIMVKAGELNVLNGAEVIVNSTGLGDAGLLSVEANSINLDTQGKLAGTTASGRGGNISLQVQDLIAMRNGSAITTTAANNGSGGNITINATFIVAVPRENSDILANANEGSGGQIEINGTGIYGLLNRTGQTPSDNISEINASSEFGIDGSIEINTPDIDTNSGLINLPTVPVDTEVAQGCTAGETQAQSELIITGRGGLPPNPGEALSSDAVQVDLVTLNPSTDNRNSSNVSKNLTTATSESIIEATGWVLNEKGEVVLTTNSSTTTPHSPWFNPASCRTS